MNSVEKKIEKKLDFWKAYKRVKSIKDFYLRLGVYCTVNAIFLTAWVFDTSPPTYFWMPTLFFVTFVAGLLVLSNAIVLYGGKYVLPKEWEERKLKEFIDKQNQKITKYE
jgi:O-antigen ligase